LQAVFSKQKDYKKIIQPFEKVNITIMCNLDDVIILEMIFVCEKITIHLECVGI